MSTAANHLRLIKAVLQSTLPVATASLRQNFIHILSSVSGSNTITATAFPGIAAYTYPTVVVMVPATTNTAATTLNVDTRGAIAVQNIDGTACVGGELVAGIPALLVLNSGATAWIIQAPANQRGLNIQNTNYTLVASDRDRTIYPNGAGPYTYTLPSSVLPACARVVIYNASSAVLTLTAAGTLSWFNGSGSFPSGNRTIAIGGAVTVEATGATNWLVTGTGIS